MSRSVQDSCNQPLLWDDAQDPGIETAERPEPRIAWQDPLRPTEHMLAVYYVIPSDIPYEQALHNRIAAASRDIQGWYQCATGGLTWQFAVPEIVQIYFAQQTRQYYRDNGNWWGSLLGEMGSQGFPVWQPGTVTAIWARGAGWWAGAAQWCEGECGVALLGAEHGHALPRAPFGAIGPLGTAQCPRSSTRFMCMLSPGSTRSVCGPVPKTA